MSSLTYFEEWATPKKWAEKWADVSPQPTHLSASQSIVRLVSWHSCTLRDQHSLNGTALPNGPAFQPYELHPSRAAIRS